eukprot:UN34198
MQHFKQLKGIVGLYGGGLNSLHFFVLAPLSWYCLHYVPDNYLYYIFVFFAQILPFCISVRVVYKYTIIHPDTEPDVKYLAWLLSYWVCWPFIDCINYIPKNTIPMDTMEEVLICTIILTIWVMFLDGSKYFYPVMFKLYNYLEKAFFFCTKFLPSGFTFGAKLWMLGYKLVSLAKQYYYVIIVLAIAIFWATLRTWVLINDVISFLYGDIWVWIQHVI